MFTDITGKKRMKLGLHIHTRRSDGRATPEQSAIYYKEAGYDAVAFTDHWKWNGDGEVCGLRILPGIEYNNITDGENVKDARKGVFHIVGIGTQSEPDVKEDATPQQMIDAINAAGGIAVLAHPEWSLETVDMVRPLKGIGATEIFNTVSDIRAYSGGFVDRAAGEGMIFPLFASDDVHSYTWDKCVASVMVDVTDGKTDTLSLVGKLKAGEFYSTCGPEVHISFDGERATVLTSPVKKIAVMSNAVCSDGRYTVGDALTQTVYYPQPNETFLRAEVFDAEGRRGWSNIIRIR